MTVYSKRFEKDLFDVKLLLPFANGGVAETLYAQLPHEITEQSTREELEAKIRELDKQLEDLSIKASNMQKKNRLERLEFEQKIKALEKEAQRNRNHSWRRGYQ